MKIHRRILNIMLQEMRIRDLPKAGIALAQSIDTLKYRYLRPAQFPWVTVLENKFDQKLVNDVDKCYNARIYGNLGVFDLTAFYLSPVLNNQFPKIIGRNDDSETQAVHAGQQLFLALIPDTSERTGLNESFLDRYERFKTYDRNLPLEPRDRFSLVLKLRLNPVQTWPKPATSIGTQHFWQAFNKACEVTSSWQKDSKEIAAITLSLGWSEFIVVAHSYSIARLHELVHHLRSLRVRKGGKADKESFSPLFLTSMTSVCCDYRFVVAASELKDGIDIAVGARTTADDMGPINASDHKPVKKGVRFATSFKTYPGGEVDLARTIKKLTELSEAKLDGVSVECPSFSETGSYDLGAFVVTTKDSRFETFALSLATTLQHQLINRYATDAKDNNPSSLHHAFLDTTTQTGLANILDIEDYEPVFIDSDNRDLHRFTDLRDELSEMLNHVIPDVARSMRILQVPYARTEQMVNLVSKISWTMRHEVVWKDSLLFAPAILCLCSYLDWLKDWWNAWSLQDRQANYQAAGSKINPDEQAVQHINSQLIGFHEDKLPGLLRVLQTNFYNLHIGGYLTDMTPDLNLQYRASVQRVLNIANMILDVFVQLLLGDRACISTVGDSTTPRIHDYCGVLVAELHADTITVPLSLETIGHEVGHRLVRHLERSFREDGAEPPTPIKDHGWSGRDRNCKVYEQLYSTYSRFCETVYFGDIASSGLFREGVSDYIECTLLCDEKKQFPTWLASWMLRHVLAALSVDQDLATQRASDDKLANVPKPEKATLRDALRRSILVFIAKDLAGRQASKDMIVAEAQRKLQSSMTKEERKVATKRLNDAKKTQSCFEDGNSFDNFNNGLVLELEPLREILNTRCVVGHWEELLESVSDPERWAELVSDVVDEEAWLLDYESASAAAAFFNGVDVYVNNCIDGESMPGPDRVPKDDNGICRLLFHEIREALSKLRQEIAECSRFSHFLTNWMDREQCEPKDNDRKRHKIKGSTKYPWRVVPQPAQQWSLANEVHDPKEKELLWRKANVVINQRVRIAARNLKTQNSMAAANNQFLADMIALLPTWRAALFSRIRAVSKLKEQNAEP